MVASKCVSMMFRVQKLMCELTLDDITMGEYLAVFVVVIWCCDKYSLYFEN